MKKSLYRLCACGLIVCLFTLSVPTPVKAETVRHVDCDEKWIALTFDDGPHPRYTSQILSLLEEYNIRATFFVIGCNLEKYPKTAKKLLSSDHEIGIHTYSHPHMKQTDVTALKKELQKTEAILAEYGKTPSPLFRPPEGSVTPAQQALLSQMHYRVILWNIDTRDWASEPAEKIVPHVRENVRGGDILLFHDYVVGKNTTITALRQLLPELLQNGYRFVTVSELLSYASEAVAPSSAGADGCSSK